MSLRVLLASELTQVYSDNDRFFIKTFLVDSSINANKWAVTEDALRRNISTFINKPIVLTPEFAHPEAPDGDQLLIEQEKFRVGVIIDIGIDNATGKGWALAEITNRDAIKMLTDTGINFVSPSIVFGPNDIEIQDNVEVVTKFEGAHLAIVKDPAYGMQKAQIKGQCRGGPECIVQLNKVQATVERSQCGGYTIINQNGEQRILKADGALEKCIQNKMDAGLTIDERALAICYEETNTTPTTETACKVDQLGNCVVPDTSLSSKELQNEVMTANDDEIRKQEEDKARKAEDEEKREEARKAEDDKEKEEARKADEDQEKKVDEIAKLKAEIDELKDDSKKAKAEAIAKPIVDKIVSAKLKLNLIKDSETEKEFELLVTLPIDQLTSIASQYSNVRKDTPYSVLTLGASTDSFDGDALLLSLGSTK